jgi:lysozyme
MKRLVVPAAAAAILAAAVASYVRPWEGNELTPYQDIVGVWTWCAGVTTGDRHDDYTREECEAINRNEAARHLAGLARCIYVPLHENEWVALGSWAYNVGVSAACRSTLVRKVNAGEPATAWCPELLRWDRAGGRKVRGLTRRREAEYRTCMGQE